jgi:hypothetical protein
MNRLHVARAARVAIVGLMIAAACGGPPTPSTPSRPQATVGVDRPALDSSGALVPAGFGTLKQSDLEIVLEPEGVHVAAIPLDESVIRALAPDSYRRLHASLDSKRTAIAQRASMRGVREPRVWYVRFYGRTPDAHFAATDLTVTSGGRDYRPFDVVPISSGFGEQRLQPRDTQTGLLLFEEGVDASQPMAVAMGSERSVDWDTNSILKKLDAERAAIRARAASRP